MRQINELLELLFNNVVIMVDNNVSCTGEYYYYYCVWDMHVQEQGLEFNIKMETGKIKKDHYLIIKYSSIVNLICALMVIHSNS